MVGAGPGHSGLMTRLGQELLTRADAVLYDYLVPIQLLLSTKPGCELISVGKAGGRPSSNQRTINEQLIANARRGKLVVRLKGGDPFLMGRGGEEAQVLADSGIPFLVVPGVSSSYAVPAFAGIPVTDRHLSSGVTISSGHLGDNKNEVRMKTQVVLMTLANLEQTVMSLLEEGYHPKTPACLISRGTTPFQREVEGELASIVERAKEAALPTPALLVVGEVVGMRSKIGWRGNLPLAGKRIVLTRPPEKNPMEIIQGLELLGAEVVSLPTVTIHPVAPDRIRALLDNLSAFNWMVFTSASAVKLLFDGMLRLNRDWRFYNEIKIAVVGEKTSRALQERGRNPDLVAIESHGEGLLKALKGNLRPGDTIALCQARQAHPILTDGLKDNGVSFTTYVLYDVNAPEYPDELIRGIFNEPFDLALFSSPLSVKNLRVIMERVGLPWLPARHMACIGPETEKELRKQGYKAWIVADKPCFVQLIDQVLMEWGVSGCTQRHASDVLGETTV